MFDAKTVILYWTSNITKFTVTTVLLCEIHVDPLMGTATLTPEAVCATPYKGIRWALWEGNHLSEHGCPLAGGHWACLLDMLHIHP